MTINRFQLGYVLTLCLVILAWIGWGILVYAINDPQIISQFSNVYTSFSQTPPVDYAQISTLAPKLWWLVALDGLLILIASWYGFNNKRLWLSIILLVVLLLQSGWALSFLYGHLISL